MLCAVIGNNGKFLAVLETKSSNEFLYQQFINEERKKKLYNHITFGDFLYNNQVLFEISKNKWNEVYNLVGGFQYNVAKKGKNMDISLLKFNLSSKEDYAKDCRTLLEEYEPYPDGYYDNLGYDEPKEADDTRELATLAKQWLEKMGI